ncbi:hypothetical protein Syun_015331 [Stephania yunnanensis]|uniref:Uncharacterized protein n=1 Tax=Stephania yunnanensis TaxID=152371 RepID=A0AAP0PCQ4_9MAGN
MALEVGDHNGLISSYLEVQKWGSQKCYLSVKRSHKCMYSGTEDPVLNLL